MALAYQIAAGWERLFEKKIPLAILGLGLANGKAEINPFFQRHYPMHDRILRILAAASSDLDLDQLPPGDFAPGDYGSAFVKMFLTLIALILLLIASYWLIRKLVQSRLQRGVGLRAIQILEKRMISPKSMLYLIEVDGQKVLLSESHLEVRKIESIKGKEETIPLASREC